MASMNDVALVCGLSKATVSRVLNRRDQVSEATRKQVINACRKLNYTINPNIQDLVLKGRSGSTRNLALIMIGVPFESQSYVTWIDRIIDEVNLRHYHLMLVKVAASVQNAYDLPPVLRDERIDGMIITGDLTGDVMKILAELEAPRMVLGTYDKKILKDCGNVTLDLYSILEELILELIARGARRIAYVQEGTSQSADNLMLHHYQDILVDQGLTFDPAICYNGSGRLSGMFHDMMSIFAGETLPFDAILAPEERIAREMDKLNCMRSGFSGRPLLPVATIRRMHNSELDEFIIYARLNDRYDEMAKNALDMLIDMIAKKTTGKTILV